MPRDLFQPAFNVTLPDADSDGDAHFAPIQIALEGLTKLNEWQIQRSLRQAAKGNGYPVPPLYLSGVRYEEDPPGHEDWRDCYKVLERGKGDCDNLVAWRCAELRVAGVDCEPVLKWQWLSSADLIAAGYPRKHTPRKGVWLVHCLVRFPDGSIEDPSKILGMTGNFLSRV